ncbi:MAG: dihydroxyacetone kinase subunit L [Chloroflexi bacterium]|nr:dihydroxyacetone kinase subunit L [Chloroflexota bacterium]
MADNAVIAGQCLDAALTIILEKEPELARLDSVAGDGDHGAGMARGFRAAVTVERAGTAGQVCMNAGMAFSNAAGGASGALVGTLIMTIGSGLQGEDLDAAKVHAALSSGYEAICKLGKAEVGDKTMLDTLDPFIKAYGEAAAAGASITGAWQQALPAAEAGMESTKDMISKRGRSAALKEKSRGTHDPGATSMYHILVAVGGVLQQECPD